MNDYIILFIIFFLLSCVICYTYMLSVSASFFQKKTHNLILIEWNVHVWYHMYNSILIEQMKFVLI